VRIAQGPLYIGPAALLKLQEKNEKKHIIFNYRDKLVG
jgi:hypothetical protein